MKKQRLLLAAAFPASLLLASCASDSNVDIRDALAKSNQGWSQLPDYERGKHQLEVGDYGLAIESFEAALAHDPNSVSALNGEAVAYDRIGRRDVAEKLFQKALALDPNSVPTLNNLAFLHLRYGETAVAEAFSARAHTALAAQTNVPTVLSQVLAGNEALLAREAAPKPVAEAAPAAVQKTGENTWNLDIAKAPLSFTPIDKPVADQMPAVQTARVDVETLETAPVIHVAPITAPVLRTGGASVASEIALNAPSVDIAEEAFAIPTRVAIGSPALVTSAPRLALAAPPVVDDVPSFVIPTPRAIDNPVLASAVALPALAAPSVDFGDGFVAPAPRDLERPALAVAPQLAALTPPPSLDLTDEFVVPAHAITIVPTLSAAPQVASLSAPPALAFDDGYVAPAALPRPVLAIAPQLAAEIAPPPALTLAPDVLLPGPRELAGRVMVTPVAPQLVAEIAAEPPILHAPIEIPKAIPVAMTPVAVPAVATVRLKPAVARSPVKLTVWRITNIGRRSVLSVASAPVLTTTSVRVIRGARLQIANASGDKGLALRLGIYLAGHGQRIGRINAAHYSAYRTRLFFHGGDERRASDIAALLPFRPQLVRLKSVSNAIEIVLGTDYRRYQQKLVTQVPKRVRLSER